MKKYLSLVFAALCACFIVPSFTGCGTAPSQRVVAVQSLKAVGQSADATVALSAQLYRDGRITADQARGVMDFYDTKFQPAYRLAVSSVQADLSSIASPDLAALAAQLAALVAPYVSNSTLTHSP
jgi:hypothetical protein